MRTLRTLLIDNYDSFTYNLVHQIAAATGREPVVVRNDDPGWRSGLLDEFDAVVISPGPGTPERAADFGVCRQVVERCELPLFGICLGHQGIAAWHGGSVSRAVEPRHGRMSPVLHPGTGLFDGIPSPFEVVRYHSLTVNGLSDDLEALAHTPDGVLMALRHLRRPMWGVQFHPESVCTSYGDRLMENFASLAREHHEGLGGTPRASVRLRGGQDARGPATRAPVDRPATPDAAAILGTPAPTATPDAPRRFEMLVHRLPTRWSDEVVFDALFREGPYAFWLDSSRPGGVNGRFSIMGDASGPLARVATADTWTGTVDVRSGSEERLVTGDFLGWLDQDLRSMEVTQSGFHHLPFDFALGWVGYLGYELKAQCGGRRAHRSAEPDAAMVFADRAVVMDHASGMTYLLTLVERDGDGDRPGGGDGRSGRERGRAWLRETADRLDGLTGRIPAPTRPFPRCEIRLRHDRDRYLELIAIAQEEIAAGETYEINLTNMAEADVPPDADPWEAYRLLRRVSPAPFGALLRFGEVSVLSTSPERFLRVTADGRAESRPIKGTRPRGTTPEHDARLRRELGACEKDRSENLMIVDLVRNDLGRHARTGSVEVTGLFEVETYDTVHQLVSTVRARLREDASALDCVRDAFPGGSMTGAPKIRTMRIIDRLEAGPRGVYSGAIGYFSPNGAADLSIVIRTAVMTPGRLRYGAGGAIVALSDPEAEFEETAVKSAPLLALTGADFPGRREAERAEAVGLT
ncbi:aminodeoxychorismate synthase component I [Streptomyces sp. ICBB 8177]|uniref:aminodeoxychorismate synthase component I n=1 Tax=Streptomyces sp. ICBB 8177 TaxID=563922 RepID=UPI000D67239B|nr:aminodeoxychorismate synthase component I [Streptomyces sp. ICBB 8177]PWI43213.1 aminodeoxychorismate synthase, component I [Streptomyces sp. ICBB 8177]